MSDEREIKDFPKDEAEEKDEVEAHVKERPVATRWAEGEDGADDVEAHVKERP